MASSQVREVWSSWTIAPVWTGCSCGAVCSGTATFAWRRSASRLCWSPCQALVGVLVYHLLSFLSPALCSDARSAGWILEGQDDYLSIQKSPRWLFLHHQGWAMQVACFVFIQRRWAEDKKHMENMLDYFCDIREPLQLLLFPEGTDLTGEKETMQHPHSIHTDFSCYFQNLTHSSTCLVPLHWCCYVSIISKCESNAKSSRAHPNSHLWKCSDLPIRAVAAPPMLKALSSHY